MDMVLDILRGVRALAIVFIAAVAFVILKIMLFLIGED